MQRLGEEVAGPHFPKDAGSADSFRYPYRLALCVVVAGQLVLACPQPIGAAPFVVTSDGPTSSNNPVVRLPLSGPEGVAASPECLVPTDEVASNEAAYQQKREQGIVPVDATAAP